MTEIRGSHSKPYNRGLMGLGLANPSHLGMADRWAHCGGTRHWLTHWGLSEEFALLALLMALGSLFVVILTYVEGHVG